MRRAVLALSLAVLATAGHARLREEQFDLPVEVADAYGKAIAQTIRVTLFRDDEQAGPRPVLVLGHGRASDAEGRARLGRARYADASRWFVQRGFLVAVPTRIGYGISGGEDVEDTGPCTGKNYPPGFAAAARQTLAVLDAVCRRTDAAPDRAVVVGQSFGGATAVAVAALAPAGVQAAINFAGGSGGNPSTSPRNPCGPLRMERLYRDYGRTARLPTLWIYAQNDLYWGEKLPREWFEAFTAAGGQGRFVQLPPHGDDGHALFTRHPEAWQPLVADFLDALGFKAPDR